MPAIFLILRMSDIDMDVSNIDMDVGDIDMDVCILKHLTMTIGINLVVDA